MNEKLLFLWTAMNPRPRVLITGFEQFGGHATNISQMVAKRFDGARSIQCPWTNQSVEVEVEFEVLSVDKNGAEATAHRIREGERWDAVLHLGLCESCVEPRFELLAHDWLDMRLPDNQGRQVSKQPIDGEGHRGCWLDLSLWKKERFPLNYTLSFDAGAYLCNETYHATLKAQSLHGHGSHMPSPTLFLHLPSEENMSVNIAVEFVEVCLGYMLRPYPKSPQHVVAACLLDGDRVLVTQRASDESDPGCWEFPGGKFEEGEAWSQALVREIHEELTLDVAAKFPLGSWYRERGAEAFVIHLVSAELVGKKQDIQLSVHQSAEWISTAQQNSRTWAGRDDEMAAFLHEAFRPMS